MLIKYVNVSPRWQFFISFLLSSLISFWPISLEWTRYSQWCEKVYQLISEHLFPCLVLLLFSFLSITGSENKFVLLSVHMEDCKEYYWTKNQLLLATIMCGESPEEK